MVLLIMVMLAVALLAVGIIDGNRFVTGRNAVERSGSSTVCRFVLLKAMHNNGYGTINDQVIEAIRRFNPDFIVLAGDLVTSQLREDMTPGIELLRTLRQDYRIYYGLGNHESKMRQRPDQFGDKYDRLIRAVSGKNVSVLKNEAVFLPEYNLKITGLDLDLNYFAHFKIQKMKPGYLQETLPECEKEKCNILIAHNPDYFAEYAQWGADLVLSGHVHGGIMRLPLLGGVIAPSYKIFPEYDGGVFRTGSAAMLLGRGMGSHTIPLRFFNPAELYDVQLKIKK